MNTYCTAVSSFFPFSRYQYLDDMISEREKANAVLRNELQK
jgi:hypothetical protein